MTPITFVTHAHRGAPTARGACRGKQVASGYALYDKFFDKYRQIYSRYTRYQKATPQLQSHSNTIDCKSLLVGLLTQRHPSRALSTGSQAYHMPYVDLTQTKLFKQ